MSVTMYEVCTGVKSVVVSVCVVYSRKVDSALSVAAEPMN